MSAWQSLCAIEGNSVVLCNEKTQTLYFMTNDEVHKYHYDNDTWIKYPIYDKLGTQYISGSTATIDDPSNTIFFLSQRGEFRSIKLAHGDYDVGCEIDIKSHHPTGTHLTGRVVMINHAFHVIGANPYDRHSKYNQATKNFEIMHEFSRFLNRAFIHHRIVRIRDKLLMMGGSSCGISYDTMSEYDIKNDKWKKLETRLPTTLSQFGCVAIMNGKYILLLGGLTALLSSSKDIQISSVNDKVFTKSITVCPQYGEFEAFSIKNRKRDEISTFGFTRWQWNEWQMDEHLFPPQYLIRIIYGYYYNEYVHLFDIHTYEHWKIDIFDII